jgi:hypothetical protein
MCPLSGELAHPWVHPKPQVDVGQVFGKSIRIRCWYHKMGNIRTRLPAEAEEEVLAHARAVRDAPTPEAGRAAAAAVVEWFADRCPAAMACLADDLDAALAYLRVPTRHRINVRTTNLLERSFVEERRRTRVIPLLLDERSAMELVCATPIRASEWCSACRCPTSNVSGCGCFEESSASIPIRPQTRRRATGGRGLLRDDPGRGVYRRCRT